MTVSTTERQAEPAVPDLEDNRKISFEQDKAWVHEPGDELVSARKPPFRAEICANSWHPERDFGTTRPRRRRLTGCGIAKASKSARMSCFQGQ